MENNLIKTILLVIAIVNIAFGLGILLIPQTKSLVAPGLSCIAVGLSCLVIYYAKTKGEKLPPE